VRLRAIRWRVLRIVDTKRKGTIDEVLPGIPHMTLLCGSPLDDFNGIRAIRRWCYAEWGRLRDERDPVLSVVTCD
jgi:hypothetical protein